MRSRTCRTPLIQRLGHRNQDPLTGRRTVLDEGKHERSRIESRGRHRDADGIRHGFGGRPTDIERSTDEIRRPHSRARGEPVVDGIGRPLRHVRRCCVDRYVRAWLAACRIDSRDQAENDQAECRDDEGHARISFPAHPCALHCSCGMARSVTRTRNRSEYGSRSLPPSLQSRCPRILALVVPPAGSVQVPAVDGGHRPSALIVDLRAAGSFIASSGHQNSEQDSRVARESRIVDLRRGIRRVLRQGPRIDDALRNRPCGGRCR